MTRGLEQLEAFSVEEMTGLRRPDWRPPRPSELPRGFDGPVAVDIETRDEGLATGRGKGWAWPDGGEVVGYSVAARGFRAYLPVAHAGGGNLEPADAVRRWLRDVLSDPAQTKVFANAQYDLGWMRRDGVELRGPVVDVQWVEALLDEHRRRYSLDSLARDHLGRGKNEDGLREAARAYGVDPKSGLWRLPAAYVAAYAEDDAALTLELWETRRRLIDDEGLRDIFDLEHSLLPLYLDVASRGVRIDVDRAEALLGRLETEVAGHLESVRAETGVRLDTPWVAAEIARAFDVAGIAYELTPKSRQPSITKELLAGLDHPVAREVRAARMKDKLAGTFVRGMILGNLRDGRVHGEIHPLRSDDGGTVSGRLSMSNPNLQQIPARTRLGREVRRLFLPEEGERWAALDFSQQELRLLVHFAYLARLDGAVDARRRYRDDPGMSYHEFTAELTGLSYKHAKNMNFAILYGRGIASAAAELGLSYDETERLFEKHHREMPFARALAEKCSRIAARRGYVRSLFGRRSRFPFWEPAGRFGVRFLPRDDAEREWPDSRLVRARTHKALNALIQSSAADQAKAAMRAVLDAGLGRHVLIQIHDELCCSVPDETTGRAIADLMRDAVSLEVPSAVDAELSDRWEGEE